MSLWHNRLTCVFEIAFFTTILFFRIGKPCSTLWSPLSRFFLTMDPRRFMIMVDIFMFLEIFYIRSYWFVTFRSLILYWSLILCEYQLWRSSEPWWTTRAPLLRNVEKWGNFKKYENANFFKAKHFLFRFLKFLNFWKCYSFLKYLCFWLCQQQAGVFTKILINYEF